MKTSAYKCNYCGELKKIPDFEYYDSSGDFVDCDICCEKCMLAHFQVIYNQNKDNPNFNAEEYIKQNIWIRGFSYNESLRFSHGTMLRAKEYCKNMLPIILRWYKQIERNNKG